MDSSQDNKKLFGFIPVVQPDSTRVVPIVAGCVALLFVVVIVIAVKTFIENRQPRIDLLYTPESAVVTLDGKLVEQGEIALSAGTHEIVVEKYGFETQVITVEAESGDTIPVHVILTPEIDDTSDWYKTHKDDGGIADGIVGYQYEAMTQEMMSQYPILNDLPVKKHGFGLYQQACEEDTLCIFVDGYKSFFDDAIDCFRDELDDDIGRYRFVFEDYYNPFLGEG